VGGNGMNLTAEEIAVASGGEIFGDKNTVISGITTDSRKAGSGMLFVALEGENFDGHNFVGSAFGKGTAAAVVKKSCSSDINGVLIKVDDTLKALGDIAKYYKSKFDLKTTAVTGSVGKTTTKDMLSSVLGQKFNTLMTKGNFNNNIGLPLTIFGLNEKHEAAVLEMGMSGFGEISYLADIARPDVAVISNIGQSHIEKLGSREGILKAKLEICDFFDENSVLIINGDDDMLYPNTRDKEFKVVSFGINNPNNDVKAYDIEDKGIDGVDFCVDIDSVRYKIHIKTPGIHNVYNALSAVCVGRHYGIDMEKIKNGLESFTLTAMRMSVENIKGMTIINDCYNASPASVEAGLKVLNSAKAKRHIAMLGDMLEMGSFSRQAHYDAGKKAAEFADVLLSAGKEAENMKKGAEDGGMKEIYTFENSSELAEFAKEFVKKNDAVLIKASRGMKFENIYNTLKL